jgi:hypothetical protein
MLYRGYTTDGKPITDWPGIYAYCADCGRFVIEVRKYDEAAEISRKQMAYLHSVVFPALADHMGVSQLMAEVILKKKCGESFFIKKVDGNEIILSKTMLTAKQTTVWMENIWDFMESVGCPVPPPDPEWFKHDNNKIEVK